jgi:uncharacterized protein
MIWLILGSGVLLGIGSATHCAGMCGPIAMVLPFQKSDGKTDWTSFSVYHIGRISAYMLIGLLIGWIGTMIRWQGLGAGLSLLSGIGLLIYGLYYMGWVSIPGQRIKLPVAFIKDIWYRAMSAPHRLWYFPAGIANGLLPCGMVYAAGTAALSMQYMEESLAVMAGFALGTLPVFVVMPLIKRFLRGRWFTGGVLLATSIGLILRGAWAIYQLLVTTANPAICHG